MSYSDKGKFIGQNHIQGCYGLGVGWRDSLLRHMRERTLWSDKDSEYQCGSGSITKDLPKFTEVNTY